MSVPVLLLLLLAFAGWTLLLLMGSVGVYRWSRILLGRAAFSDFPTERTHGSDWYRRAMRAHANCVENLAVYGAVVLSMVLLRVRGPVLDALAMVLTVVRVGQTRVRASCTSSRSRRAVRSACGSRSTSWR